MVCGPSLTRHAILVMRERDASPRVNGDGMDRGASHNVAHPWLSTPQLTITIS